jgi:hypothetical protein
MEDKGIRERTNLSIRERTHDMRTYLILGSAPDQVIAPDMYML